jgi:hypothetical protein
MKYISPAVLIGLLLLANVLYVYRTRESAEGAAIQVMDFDYVMTMGRIGQRLQTDSDFQEMIKRYAIVRDKITEPKARRYLDRLFAKSGQSEPKLEG